MGENDQEHSPTRFYVGGGSFERDIPGVGLVSFRGIVMGDHEKFRADLASAHDDDEFVRRTLTRHVFKSDGLMPVSSWSDESIDAALWGFSSEPHKGFGIDIDDDENTRAAFRNAAQQYLDRSNAEFREEMGRISERISAASRIGDLVSRPSAMLGVFDLTRVAQWTQIDAVSNALNMATTGLNIPSLNLGMGADIVKATQGIYGPALKTALSSAVAGLADNTAIQWHDIVADLTRIPDDVLSAARWNFADQIGDAVQNINSFFTASISGIDPRSATFQPFIENFEEFRAAMASHAEEMRALKEAGYEHTTVFILANSVSDLLVDGKAAPPEVVAARMAEMVEEEDTAEWVSGMADDTPIILPRKEILLDIVESHKAGRYYASVALALSQIEGIVSDLLVIGNVAVRKGSKTYKLDPSKGDGYLGSAKPKLALAVEKEIIDDAINRAINPYLDSGLAAFDRNDVLHGSALGFGERNESARLILILMALLVVANSIDSASDPTAA